MPRARWVPRARFGASRSEVLDLVSRDDFDPRREVVLEGPPGDSVAAAEASGSARVERYAPETIDVFVDAPAAGWLVLSEVFYPGWTATVSGKPAPILRADGVFRAVRLEAGRHAVVFNYAPASFVLGARLSGLGAGTLLVTVGAMWIRRRPRREP